MKITLHETRTELHLSLPFADDGITAGFPRPAQDYMTERIDLNEFLIRNPDTTFLGRVLGDSLIEDAIETGDIVIIDRSLVAVHGSLALCCLNGEFTIKYYSNKEGKTKLIPANNEYEPIEVNSCDDFKVWGIITYSISDRRKPKKFL